MSLRCTDSRFKPLGNTFFVPGSDCEFTTRQESEHNSAVSGCAPAGSSTETCERAQCLRRSYSFAGYVPYWLEAQHESPEENDEFVQDPVGTGSLNTPENQSENTSENISDNSVQIMSEDMSQNHLQCPAPTNPCGLQTTLTDADSDVVAETLTSFEWPDTDDEYESRVSYQRPSQLSSKSKSFTHLPEVHDLLIEKCNKRANLHQRRFNSLEDWDDTQFDDKSFQPGAANWPLILDDGRDDTIVETKRQTRTATNGGPSLPIGGQPPANITCTPPSMSTPGWLAVTIMGASTRPAVEPSTPNSSLPSPEGRSLRLADHVCFGNSERTEPHANSEATEVASSEKVSAAESGSKRKPSKKVTETPSSEAVTTLMIRNLPIGITQPRLLDELNMSGFAGKYDFCYMPCTFTSGEGKGFAFINLVTPAIAQAFKGGWHNSRRFEMKPSDAGINISTALLQGKEANVAKWDSARLRRVRNPRLRPFVLDDAPVEAAEEHKPGRSETLPTLLGARLTSSPCMLKKDSNRPIGLALSLEESA